MEDKAEPVEPRALPDSVAAPISGLSSMMQVRLARVSAGSFSASARRPASSVSGAPGMAAVPACVKPFIAASNKAGGQGGLAARTPRESGVRGAERSHLADPSLGIAWQCFQHLSGRQAAFGGGARQRSGAAPEIR